MTRIELAGVGGGCPIRADGGPLQMLVMRYGVALSLGRQRGHDSLILGVTAQTQTCAEREPVKLK